MKKYALHNLEYLLPYLLIGFVAYRSSVEFYQIAWGTGNKIGEFSLTWFALFAAYILFCLFLLYVFFVLIWRQDLTRSTVRRLVDFRERWPWLGLLLGALVVIGPGWLLQYTTWGVVFHTPYIRILLWLLSTLLFSAMITRGEHMAGWGELLAALVVSAAVFSILAPLQNAHAYPFSLGWSEGNRIWDYSIMFGRAVYDYPAGRDIPVLLDQGRQFLGGLPFLFPGLTIAMERAYLGLIQILPYFLVGILAFRKLPETRIVRVIFTLWTFLFLSQGPIHIPLVLCAALTVLAWRSSYWAAIPLLVFSGYFAQASRFTWLFAPAIWIVMLEFSSASLLNNRVRPQTWIRSAVLGSAGVFGGYLLPKLLAVMHVATSAFLNIDLENVGETIGNSGLTAEQVSFEVTHQPLLWYRLLPNSTYGNGILLGLLLATGPLLILLLYLAAGKYWKMNGWQKLSIVLPLLAFLVVGLVASTKIGGGGDLHNMDMFLIGLLFTSVVAWHQGEMHWIRDAAALPWVIKAVIVFWFFAVTINPLFELRSHTLGQQAAWLETLVDAPNEAALGMLPTSREVGDALATIQKAVDTAKVHGEVLFIDQRQLLTFGYVRNVPFVPEYEKKLLMNEALAHNGTYFQKFYEDISRQRFSLILSEPLHTPVQDSSFQFGEENNAWVTWVSIPVLCYYEPQDTLKSVRVQLLIPKKDIQGCSSVLPK